MSTHDQKRFGVLTTSKKPLRRDNTQTVRLIHDYNAGPRPDNNSSASLENNKKTHFEGPNIGSLGRLWLSKAAPFGAVFWCWKPSLGTGPESEGKREGVSLLRVYPLLWLVSI